MPRLIRTIECCCFIAVLYQVVDFMRNHIEKCSTLKKRALQLSDCRRRV
jgi:hypothetical protein